MNPEEFAKKNAEEREEVSGTVEHIVFQNEGNGYTVCELTAEDGEEITVTGILPFLGVGEIIRAYGKWEVHATYGRQFRVEEFEKRLPGDEAAIRKYLSSRIIKGIGPVTAGKLVDKYGVDTFDVIENHPDWLAEFPGITQKKAKKISEDFKEQFGIRSVMMFCRDFFGPATAVKVYKRFGGSAVDIIKRNPFSLCDEVRGVGFETADRIASSLGMPGDSAERVSSGIKYLLSFNARQNGHTFLPKERVLEGACSLLGVGEEHVERALAYLKENKELVSVKYEGRECLYLKELYDAEKYIADKLDLLDSLTVTLPDTDVMRFISQIEYETGMEYAVNQKKAIMAALKNGVMILTGGPGTGKTTVVRAALLVFDRMGLKVALAAPTGRAAKRMSDAASREAKTIHRLLEMEYSEDDEPRFLKNEKDLLSEDVIIIDEMSMVDTLLFESLLRAVKPGARVILIGDADQLPSVGAGNVMNDLIASDRFRTVKLKEVFRQARESLIVINAHEINNGEYPKLDAKDGDFFFLNRKTEEEIAGTIVNLVVSRLPKAYPDRFRGGIQVITPMHKGGVGTLILNEKLQAALNPPDRRKKEKKVRDRVFREGDRIMQIRNNYDIEWSRGEQIGVGIFNGDIGVIEAIDFENETMRINFDERIADYEFTALEDLEHAFAITIHKSQGSEYPVVIMPVTEGSPRMMTRNLLYTAVTRAQEMVILVGRPEYVMAMVDNDRHVQRYTGLVYILSGGNGR
ncbi:MAG: ATP-dependent RecD-like DNA helicase [Lachnospiraceae bacterium]|nr:ATP-dependent RecD-like DNA helicase [Lachnospiraceae bacterium]